MTRVIHLVLLFYSGLLPFYPIKETHLEIFLPSVYFRYSKNILDKCNYKKSFGVIVLTHITIFRSKMGNSDNVLLKNFMIKVMDALLLRPALFRHLKKRGIQVMKFYNFRIY